MLSEQHRQRLKAVAQDSVQHGLTVQTALHVELTNTSLELSTLKASFVTLKINGNLRGCIGTLEAHRSLIEDVAHNAYAAAFKDSRFSPVTEKEISRLQYHISVLSVPQTMQIDNEADLYRQLQAGRDGIVLIDKNHRSTFLPCVWESLTTPQSFIEQLKIKAGLDANYWSDSINFERYEVEEF